MKRSTTLLVQAATVLAGLGALVILLGGPHLEGRNAHATLFQIYFQDPFLAFIYLASIPYFIALRQAFKAARCIEPEATRALRTIQGCALCMAGFAAVGEAVILLGESDDHAGGVFIGALIALGAIAVFATAAKLERRISRSLAHPFTRPQLVARRDY